MIPLAWYPSAHDDLTRRYAMLADVNHYTVLVR
jgi:hypothetical protein